MRRGLPTKRTQTPDGDEWNGWPRLLAIGVAQRREVVGYVRTAHCVRLRARQAGRRHLLSLRDPGCKQPLHVTWMRRSPKRRQSPLRNEAKIACETKPRSVTKRSQGRLR